MFCMRSNILRLRNTSRCHSNADDRGDSADVAGALRTVLGGGSSSFIFVLAVCRRGLRVIVRREEYHQHGGQLHGASTT